MAFVCKLKTDLEAKVPVDDKCHFQDPRCQIDFHIKCYWKIRRFSKCLCLFRPNLHVIYNMWAASRENCLQACAKCANSDHLVHALSIIRFFILHLYILYNTMLLLADSEGTDQTVRMHTLIRAFAVRIHVRQKAHFPMAQPM